PQGSPTPPPPPVAAAPSIEESLDLIAVKTLKGDIRDFLLDRQKHDHSALPWNLRGEEEQQRAIDQADAAAELLVRRVFALVQSQGRPAIVATLKEVKRGAEKIEAKLVVAPNAELRHALFDATKREVLVVLGESDVLMGDRGKPKPKDPRQTEMFADDAAGGGANDNGGGDGDDGRDDDGPIFDRTPSGRRT
ncbi:MAG: hypothetical protein IRZ13_10145, partial [Acetobacteraceae bacterium]|nr:hypothetical protein [Acetobacteraceae bacterium]